MGLDEPNMSDNTLLVSVEDLINMSMGPAEGNCVDFKMVQTVLHILARQMRLLEQKVVMEVGELPPPTVLKPPKSKTPTPTSTSTETDKQRATARKKTREADIQEEPEGRATTPGRRRGSRERSRSAITDRSEGAIRDKSRGREEQKDKERAEKEAAKERERMEKMSPKDREKAEREAQKEKEKYDKMSQKEKEKYDKMSQKEREKAEREAQKEKEKYDKMSQKEKDKADKEAQKEKEKYDKMSQKEKEKADKEAQKQKEKYDKMSQKEKEKADKEAQKEKEKYDKMSQKEKEKADKEKEKYEKMSAKEREKADKEAQKEKEKYDKMSQKEREKADKEREKYEKMSAKEREKADREAQKEKEKYDKMSQKEREKADKEKEKYEKMSQKEREKADKEAQREKEKMESASGRKEGKRGRGEETDVAGKRPPISVTEVTTKSKEKVLVVEKGPTTRATEAGRGRASIEVVTRSQFALLEAAVAALKERAGPLPPLTLPDNKQLRTDLARGSVSLNDAMQAMQVSARVQAAEAAIGRLGGLLTQLAARDPGAAGLLDYEDDDSVLETLPQQAQEPRRPSAASRKSVMIQAKATRGEGGPGGQGGVSKRQSLASAASRASAPSARPSMTSRVTLSGTGHVTHPQMNDALQNMRDELMRNVQNMTTRANSAADTASNFAKSVAEKLEVALSLDSRINALQSLVKDYAEQLAGFDAGLTTQMQSFQEQMLQMRSDLRGGLVQLDNANNNAETAAVMELTERYDLLVMDLDQTLLAHQALTTFQEQLSIDFRSLLECVEMLREQKADRDEVLDGLRDKADNERLAGLLREEEFEAARADLERRLDMCHDKFRRQDAVWVAAIKDLTTVVQTKAELMELLKTREETTSQLQEMQDMIRKLALVLGEPKAAMLTRKLARGALCGACLAPALMEPEEARRPPALPRHPPVGADRPCEPDWRPPESPDLRTHICHRWVGGSHTLVSAGAKRLAGPLPGLPLVTKKYVGQGNDGRLYMMEAALEPCAECSPPEPDAQPGAGGDGADRDPQRRIIVGEPTDEKAESARDPVVQDKMPD